MVTTVGSGAHTFEVVEDWAKMPPGWSAPMAAVAVDSQDWVYGFNRGEHHGNVILKTFSEDGFIDDLASCKGVICNGGFSLISEAVYLKKPVCSIPIQNQFEQFVNAAYIEKLGYGRHFGKMASDSIAAFLYEIERFHDNLAGYCQDGNELLFQALEREMEKL